MVCISVHPNNSILESGRVRASLTRKKEMVKILRLFLLEAAHWRYAVRKKAIKEVGKKRQSVSRYLNSCSKTQGIKDLVSLNGTDPKAESVG